MKNKVGIICFIDQEIPYTRLLLSKLTRYSKMNGNRMAFLITGKVVEDFGAVVLEVKI